MINSSPIDSWEGAAAFFNWAGTSGAMLWFVVMVVLCILPVLTSLYAENAAEKQYSSKRKKR